MNYVDVYLLILFYYCTDGSYVNALVLYQMSVMQNAVILLYASMLLCTFELSTSRVKA